MGDLNDKYMLSYKYSRCVVCGIEDGLTKHHVIPYCYKRHFPKTVKDRSCYDILVLCRDCHKKYEVNSIELKKYYSNKSGLPFNNSQNKQLNRILGLVNTLLKHGHKIPNDKKELMAGIIKDFYKVDCISNEFLKEICINYKENYIFHGKVVVDNESDLNEFCKVWRHHFLNVMQPKFLSEHWNPDRDIYVKSKFKQFMMIL